MARLLLRALVLAGFAPAVASGLRSYEPDGDEGRQRALREAGRAEATRLLALYRAAPAAARPRLWFTYHCYYKAPDWIGPAVADGLGIPYVVAEGSRAKKRAGGPWALAHRGAEAALDRVERLFAMTSRDAQALRRDAPPGQRVIDLLPFLDLAEWPAPRPRSGSARPGTHLLAVAMMRAGDKLSSYRLLAEALARLPGDARPWTLTIAGDGPARATVEALFAPFAGRVVFEGVVDDRHRLAALYGAADLLVWPAVNEAYGMALLEAQGMGCPVLAGRVGGVPDVIRDGATGLLVAPGDASAFAAALAGLMAEPVRLAAMREPASVFVRSERGLDRAAGLLADTLDGLLQGPEAELRSAPQDEEVVRPKKNSRPVSGTT